RRGPRGEGRRAPAGGRARLRGRPLRQPHRAPPAPIGQGPRGVSFPHFTEGAAMSRTNPELLRSAGVAALGSFLFGFDTAVISGATEALRLHYALTSQSLGLTVASALLGTILGSIGVGRPTETNGRRPVLRALAVLYFVSALGCGFAWSWEALLVCRF